MAVVRKPKAVRLAFRATEEDFEMLNALVEQTGMASSDVMRQAIRALYRRDIGDAGHLLHVRDVRHPTALSRQRPPKKKSLPRGSRG